MPILRPFPYAVFVTKHKTPGTPRGRMLLRRATSSWIEYKRGTAKKSQRGGKQLPANLLPAVPKETDFGRVARPAINGVGSFRSRLGILQKG